MTYEEKFEAINALGEASVHMRKPGDWYVSQATEIKDGGMLCGHYGDGTSPEAAIEDHWRVLTELNPHQYVVINAAGPDRQALSWNGYRWASVRES